MGPTSGKAKGKKVKKKETFGSRRVKNGGARRGKLQAAQQKVEKEEYLEVDGLLAVRFVADSISSRFEYCIKWTGYELKDSTWEEHDTLTNPKLQRERDTLKAEFYSLKLTPGHVLWKLHLEAVRIVNDQYQYLVGWRGYNLSDLMRQTPWMLQGDLAIGGQPVLVNEAKDLRKAHQARKLQPGLALLSKDIGAAWAMIPKKKACGGFLEAAVADARERELGGGQCNLNSVAQPKRAVREISRSSVSAGAKKKGAHHRDSDTIGETVGGPHVWEGDHSSRVIGDVECNLSDWTNNRTTFGGSLVGHFSTAGTPRLGVETKISEKSAAHDLGLAGRGSKFLGAGEENRFDTKSAGRPSVTRPPPRQKIDVTELGQMRKKAITDYLGASKLVERLSHQGANLNDFTVNTYLSLMRIKYCFQEFNPQKRYAVCSTSFLTKLMNPTSEVEVHRNTPRLSRVYGLGDRIAEGMAEDASGHELVLELLISHLT